MTPDTRSDEEIARTLDLIEGHLARARTAFPADRNKVYAYLKIIASLGFACCKPRDPRDPIPESDPSLGGKLKIDPAA